ncbi:hypothetical protein PSC71_09180 [Devosia sp. J2-20]|uniref:hypothetical protein n=1 Tax=Devosia sp. J2-20 TaxID=3026161 RepID=UPI00249B0333|nr:hypothetical protein [Devosia sp. J2-20]WDR00886.1 hypothetical protein PSC71_09180 [Devosia sp. J2-20]
MSNFKNTTMNRRTLLAGASSICIGAAIPALAAEPAFSDSDVRQMLEFVDKLYQLPDPERRWFIDQMERQQRGEANAIEGTAPIPTFAGGVGYAE